ncbi:unnamed protein product [Lactuca virosa]|uniref:Uncharacterized protein n=1 Tax=Lactuca virosa TaxID=75947 RepID=A0AAU9MXI7_9ASTR|nr:unnamed protein product [Lactuca virosa]
MSSPLSATVSVHQCTSHAPQDTDYPICTTTISSSLQPPMREAGRSFLRALCNLCFLPMSALMVLGMVVLIAAVSLDVLTAGQLVFGYQILYHMKTINFKTQRKGNQLTYHLIPFSRRQRTILIR